MCKNTQKNKCWFLHPNRHFEFETSFLCFSVGPVLAEAEETPSPGPVHPCAPVRICRRSQPCAHLWQVSVMSARSFMHFIFYHHSLTLGFIADGGLPTLVWIISVAIWWSCSPWVRTLPCRTSYATLNPFRPNWRSSIEDSEGHWPAVNVLFWVWWTSWYYKYYISSHQVFSLYSYSSLCARNWIMFTRPAMEMPNRRPK